MFEDLTKTLDSYLKPRAFSPLGPPSERHGSWEWAFHKRTDLDRFVIVALTSLPEQISASISPYAIEVFAGAEDGMHFARHLVRESILLYPATKPDDWLKDNLGAAADMAERFKSADLLEPYLPQRAQR